MSVCLFSENTYVREREFVCVCVCDGELTTEV